MRDIYFFGQNKSVVLYTYRKQIYRATLDGGQLVRPVLLSGDYAEGLSDAYYRGTVYYSYISSKRELLLKNMTDRTPEYKVSITADKSILVPQLAEWNGSLLLCYLKSGEDGRYQFKGEFPFEDRSFLLPGSYPADAKYNFLLSDDKLFLVISTLVEHWCFVSERMGDFTEWTRKREEEESGKEEGSDSQELSERIQLLEEKLREKEAVIESVKTQYEDLMNTAIQYRDEAKKWRGKYLAKR